mgnify:CR=1 FL=1
MSETPTYRIRDWDEHFEVAQSRKIEGPLTWLATPTKHDGLGYRRLMAMKDGPALYGAWVLIASVAAKCPARGILADESGPLTSEDLELKTGCPADLFERALEVLCSKRIGWMASSGSGVVSPEPLENQSSGSGVVSPEPDGSHSTPATIQNKTVQDSTGQNIKAREGSAREPSRKEKPDSSPKSQPYPDEFEAFWDSYPRKNRGEKGAAHRAWKKALAVLKSKRAPPDGMTFAEFLLRSVRAYAKTEKVQQGYPLSPRNWLERGCYDDDHSPGRSKKHAGAYDPETDSIPPPSDLYKDSPI